MNPTPPLRDSGLCWWSPRIVRESDPRQLRLDLVAREEGRDPDPVTEARKRPVERRKRQPDA